MICISHCHIMVLSMLMLWLPKNTFLNLFFVFEHFFHFYACAFKRLTCIICTFILHINCELISSVSFSFVCIQFANIILLWPKLHDNWISWCDNYISFSKKPLYYAAASKYLCFIDFGPLYVSLLHIFTSYPFRFLVHDVLNDINVFKYIFVPFI